MSQEEKILYLDPRRSSGRGATHQVCDRIRQLALKRLGVLLNHMLDNADDALFERAEKAQSSQIQTGYFHGMRQLRLRRRELDEEFQREIFAGFRRLLSTTAARRAPPAPHTDDVALSLLDNATLETAIAVESMVAKLRLRCTLPLSHLELRLDHLVPHCQVDDKTNPLDPQQICDAFVSAARTLEIELAARLVVYKLFDKYVLGELPGLYDEINATLVEIGILPQLKGLPRQFDDDKPQPTAAEPALPGNAAPAPAPAPAPVPLFDTLQQLLSGQRQGGAPAAGASSWTGTGYGVASIGTGPAAEPILPQASLGDVVAALSMLQHGSGGAEDSDAGLKHLLSQVLLRQSGSSRALGRTEDDTIDIVGLLFEAILDDPQLPASIKALIARLQIPVLKVALIDRQFFGSGKHPARRLINEMSRAALGWIEPAQPERDPLYRQVDRVVDRVLTEFDDDVQLFEDLLRDFLIFLEEEQERAQLMEERTRQAAEGKAKVDGAKARVDAELARRLAGRRPPQVVRSLLDDAWAKVLFISFLKEGEEGEPWRRQLSLVDRLLWSVEPKPSADSRKALLEEIPRLLQELRDGLNGILFNPFEMTRLFKALEAEHIRCLATVGQPGGAAALAPPPVSEPPPDAPPPAELDDGLAESIAQLKSMPIGTWFELAQGNGGRVRAKLSAKLSGNRRYIFVNRAGFKMADKPLEEMARDLSSGAAAVLDDNLLFDKALETVINNLRELRVEGGWN